MLAHYVENVRAPLTGPSPVGEKLGSFDDDYSFIRNEFRKLGTPAAEGLDWEAVSQRGMDLVGSRSKDVKIASQLCLSLYQSHGYKGLASGLMALTALMESHWDECYPPIRKYQVRLRDLNWVYSRLPPLIEGTRPKAEDLPHLLTSIAEAESQRAFFRKTYKPQERPGIKGLITQLQNWMTEVEATLPPPEKETSEVNVQEEKKTKDRGAIGEVNGVEGEAADSSPQLKQTKVPERSRGESDKGDAPTLPRPAISQALTTDLKPPAPDANEQEVLTSLRNALKVCAAAAERLAALEVVHPQVYYLRRISAWASIRSLPSNEAGRTRISAPAKREVKALEGFVGNRDWTSLLRSVERRLTSAPLWLDLQQYASQCLDSLGAPYERARNSVNQSVLDLLARLPGLDSLTFKDGMPFANAQTKAWLEELRAASTSGEGETPPWKKAAREAIKGLAQDPVSGFQALQSLAREAGAGEIRFEIELMTANLCNELGHRQQALSLFERLNCTSKRHGLDDWRPDLASDLLHAHLRCASAQLNPKKPSPHLAEQIKSLQNRLSLLDLGRAIGM